MDNIINNSTLSDLQNYMAQDEKDKTYCCAISCGCMIVYSLKTLEDLATLMNGIL